MLFTSTSMLPKARPCVDCRGARRGIGDVHLLGGISLPPRACFEHSSPWRHCRGEEHDLRAVRAKSSTIERPPRFYP
jgi:hypothetical protein